MNTRKILDPRLLAPALVLGFSTGIGAQDDFFFDDDEIDEVPVVEQYDAIIKIGVGYLDGGTRHFGRDAGLTGNRVEPLIDLRARGRPDWDSDSAYFWRVEGYRLGWDSRRLEIEAGEQGTQKFGLSWRELPSHRVEGGLTPFIGGNSGSFSLPPGWEATGNTTAGMLTLNENLRMVNVGTQRERLDLNYWRAMQDRWRFNVDFRNETKDGSRVAGAIFGFSGGNPRSVLLPVPVDQTTRIIDVSLEYGADRYLFGLAYHGSFFENDQPSVSWQNPYGQHPQWAPGTGFPEGFGRLSLAPDNEFHQVRTYGVWHFGDRSQFNADVAVGRMEQDDRFLPFTINQNIALDVPLPRDSLDGRIDTTLVNLRLTNQPVDRLRLVFNYRYDDRDNTTPQNVYQLVGADSEPVQKSFESSRINLPYSYRKQELKGDASWRFAGRTRLVGGLRYMEEDRDNFSEVASLDEWGASVGMRGSFSPKVSYRVDYEYADRNYDQYDGRAPYVAGHVPGSVSPDSFENHPNLRKFNMADRERNQLRTRLDFQPLDVLSFGLGYQYSKDDYDDQRFGIDHARIQSLSADTGYYPTAHVSLSGFYSRDRYETVQSGRDFAPNNPFDPTRDWLADHEDRIDTLGLTLEFSDIARQMEALTRAGLNRQLDLGFDFLYMQTRGKIDITTGPSLNAEPLPDTVNRLNAYKVWAKYQFAPQWHTRFSVEHERFDAQNYALDNVEIDTLANVLLLGQQSPSYNVTWFMLSLGYQF